MKYFKFILLAVFLLIVNQNANAQDWANLQKFQNENNQLMNSGVKENSVVFMGNSITESWLTFHPEFFEGKPYINRGISGQTTSQMLLRFRQDVINLKPSVVVILAGINDIAQNTGPISIEMIAENIKSMAELAMVNHIKVVLCSVLPAIDFSWRPGLEPAEKIIKLNSLIETYANAKNIVYVDYFSAMVDSSKGLKKDLGLDTVHPNKNGYLIMEPLLEKELKKIFNQN
ncbi:SGNH/GDSL hydrolase family protein [Gaetbulibacter sp. M235]|uniref:SGNH/GDSL hydrolase family protein n=1 Tax=Gaetbulibacter sp. M235 TaxID=3126510 RepID=UPI00374E4B5E